MGYSSSRTGIGLLVLALVLIGTPSVFAACGDLVVDAGEACDPPGYSFLCNTDPPGGGGLGNPNAWGYQNCTLDCSTFTACVTSRPNLQAGDIFAINDAYFPAMSVDATQPRTVVIDIHDYRVNRNNILIQASVYDDQGNIVPNHTFNITTGTAQTSVITMNVDPDPAHALEVGRTYTLDVNVGHNPPIAEKITGNNHVKISFTGVTLAQNYSVPDQTPIMSFLVSASVLGWLFVAQRKKN